MRLKPSVLAIDDDPLFRGALESVLTRFGLIIKATEDPVEFLKYAESLKPDLYLIDLQMGETNGFTLIEGLKAKNPEAVIVVISGTTENKDITHALELGANDFILKPLDRVLLASKLARFLETEQIHEHEMAWVDFREGAVSAQLLLDAQIESLDEYGITIATPHLIPKGTVLKFRSPFLVSIGGKDEDYLVSVNATSYNLEAGLYSAYLEFEDTAEEIGQLLRRWLLQRPKTA